MSEASSAPTFIYLGTHHVLQPALPFALHTYVAGIRIDPPMAHGSAQKRSETYFIASAPPAQEVGERPLKGFVGIARVTPEGVRDPFLVVEGTARGKTKMTRERAVLAHNYVVGQLERGIVPTEADVRRVLW